MKTIISRLSRHASFVLLLALGLSACGKDNQPPEKDPVRHDSDGKPIKFKKFSGGDRDRVSEDE